MVNNKEDLLLCAENAAKYVNENTGGTFIPFILDVLDFVKRQEGEEQQKTQQLYEILYNVKNSNIGMLGGGKSLKNSYVQFIDDFLKITKVQGEYKIINSDFKDFSIEELDYVFAWVRRLIKEQSVRQGQLNNNNKERMGSKNQNYHNRRETQNPKYNGDKYIKGNKRNCNATDSDSNVNEQMMEQLKRWSKNNRL